MIGSASQEGELCSTGTAGILIEKGNEQRLTCSFHCWEDQHARTGDGYDLAGQLLRRGSKPLERRTHCGRLIRRIGGRGRKRHVLRDN